MDLGIKNKIAIVAASSKGLGKGVALGLAEEGVNLTICARGIEALEATAEEIRSKTGVGVLPIQADVSTTDDIKRVVSETLRHYSKLHILVNNAGIYPDEPPIYEMPEEFWDRMFNVNVKGVFYCLKAVVPDMIKRRSGKIINLSSVTGPMVSVPHSNAYSSTKAAISGLTRALALELADHGINVNAMCPGYVKTPGSQYLAEKENKIAASIPLKRFGSVDDVGDLAVFLASDESKYITGTEIVIDGGNTIQEVKSVA